MKMVNNQKARPVILLSVLVLVVLLSINYLSALNASIGNGKVVLYNDTGVVVEKYVRVINDNDVSVVIQLLPDGDLKDYFKFKRNNITLGPHQETDAYYQLLIAKEGRTNNSINVMFTEVGKKGGIILPASVIVFAKKGNQTSSNNWLDWLKGDSNNDLNNSTNSDNSNNSKNKTNPLAIGLVLTAVVFVVLLVLLYFYSKKKVNSENKEGGKINKKKRV